MNNMRVRSFLPIFSGALPSQQLQTRKKIHSALLLFIPISMQTGNLKILSEECFCFGLWANFYSPGIWHENKTLMAGSLRGGASLIIFIDSDLTLSNWTSFWRRQIHVHAVLYFGSEEIILCCIHFPLKALIWCVFPFATNFLLFAMSY